MHDARTDEFRRRVLVLIHRKDQDIDPLLCLFGLDDDAQSLLGEYDARTRPVANSHVQSALVPRFRRRCRFDCPRRRFVRLCGGEQIVVVQTQTRVHAKPKRFPTRRRRGKTSLFATLGVSPRRNF